MLCFFPKSISYYNLPDTYIEAFTKFYMTDTITPASAGKSHWKWLDITVKYTVELLISFSIKLVWASKSEYL